MEISSRQLHKQTQCVHGPARPAHELGGITTPIYTSTSYAFPNKQNQVYYPRYFNLPSQTVVAERICQLERGETGLVLSSGMAAISSTMLGLLVHGDHAVFHRDLYGGTHTLVTTRLPKLGIEYSLVQGNTVEEFAAALRPNTKLIYFETPTNPLLTIVDIRSIAQLASRRRIVTVIDNTFATPINQNPLELGIDVVVHSGTKYLNGHSDVNCGAVVTSGELMRPIKQCAVSLGGTLDVRACYLLERGLKTLHLRVERQNENALVLARFLQTHPSVRRVYYPGVPEHPGHAIAARQMSAFGGMLSLELDMDEQTAKERMGRLAVATMAISLGGVETLVTFPKDTSHANLSADERRHLEIADTLVRVSVGIEHIDDLVGDFQRALG
jgi:cystathionine beta-lyase